MSAEAAQNSADLPEYRPRLRIFDIQDATGEGAAELLDADAGHELLILDEIDVDPFDVNTVAMIMQGNGILRRSDLQGEAVFLTNEQFEWLCETTGCDHLFVMASTGKTRTIRRGCIPPGKELVILECHLS